jgi:hypothetical protein
MAEMRIPITVPGAKQAARDIQSVGRATRGTADEQARLERILQRSAAEGERLFARRAAIVGRQQKAGDRETARLERSLRVSGPTQRLQRAQGAYAAAMASGDKQAAQDAEFAMARARVGIQRGRHQLARTGGGGFTDRAIGALSSTRLNLGPVSPLVGQAAEAFGIPAVGPFAAAIGAVSIAATGFAKAVQEASRNLNELGEAARLTGGGGRDVGQLGAFGLRGGAAAGAAAGFQGRISGGDPFATMIAQQHGFFNLPRPFGDVNEAKGLAAALTYLRGIRDEGQRLREARVLGLEGELRYINVSERLYRLRQDQAVIEERLINSGAARGANELAIATETAKDAWSNLISDLGTPFVAGLAEDFKDLAGGIQAAQNAWDQPGVFARISEAFDNVQKDLENAGLAAHNWIARLLHLPESQGDPEDEGAKATRENTEAINKMTGVLKGPVLGPRGAAAIPPGYTGQQLRQIIESGAMRRGQIVQ